MNNLTQFIVVAGLACCFSAGAYAQDLSSTTWRLTAMGGDSIEDDDAPSLTFAADGTVSGNGGCNQFKGRFVTNEDAILFSPLATTMMICEDAVSDREMVFLAALQTVRAFDTAESDLILKDAGGATVLTLTAD